MNKRELIHTYIIGWKENDKEKILSTLTEDCRIIESHGPIYNGKEEISKWIDNWVAEGSKVTKWKSISYYESEESAFIEWIFECTVNCKAHHIEGASIFKFDNDKIFFIREYKTTKARYPPLETK